MIEHRSLAKIGGLDIGWLKAKHHFAIGRYGNSAHRPVGSLYVWNDDEIAPHTGFAMHPHANVEIITYVREGVISHEDDLGNRGHTKAGDVQVMSAGTGIRHSERNDEETPTRIFQIWIEPNHPGGAPRWSTQAFPRADRAGQFVSLASGSGAPDALPIRADAEVFGATLLAGDTARLDLGVGYGAYLVPAMGSVIVNGVRLAAREGVALREEPSIEVEALSDAELILVVAANSA
ncbi:pirin family protein [Paraburkholderia nemoris]|uniref:pirin family protein n=1 Tax=Paraburkholderia nemoris TaxID=2793076 RepID=UPI0038BB8498